MNGKCIVVASFYYLLGFLFFVGLGLISSHFFQLGLGAIVMSWLCRHSWRRFDLSTVHSCYHFDDEQFLYVV